MGNRELVVLTVLAAMFVCEVAIVASDSGVSVWVEDPLVKVLKTASAPAGAVSSIVIDAVRGEYESAQIVVRAAGKPIERLETVAEPLKGPGKNAPLIEARFVGYVPVRFGTQHTPDEHLVAKPPMDLPDPILDRNSVSVELEMNQPVWITVHVPSDAEPGKYVGRIRIVGDGSTSFVPITVNVRKFVLPDKRTLQITNWFSPGNIAKWHHVKLWGEPFWKILEVYARFMASYRQNVVVTPIWQLVGVTDDGKGKLDFDFSRFDRWVALFQKAGVIGTIEGGHMGSRTPWDAPDFDSWWPRITLPDGSERPTPSVKVTSEEYRGFLAQFLPTLQKHLEEKRWLDSYVQHLCDEPIKENAESYKKLASYVRRYAPKLKVFEACMCSELVGAIDVWVPQPEHFEKDIEFFRERQKAGDEVWFYTCLAPKGKYMNRFIDYPLIDVRLLHWVNFKYDLPGYLHWGFNYAQADPFAELEPDWGGGNHLPPGDSHIIYPGKRAPLSSIRLEAMRDGIEDYEMLRLLEKKNSKLARRICDSVVRSLTDYTMGPGQFRKARAKILTALDKAK